MTKKRSTKRALLLSALSLLMCVSMLVGSTFAWFTDSVTSKNNIIKSGNLDVELDYIKVVDGVATDWATVKDQDNIFNKDALWEPGHVEVVYLRVSNKGSLQLKYQLGVNVYKEIIGKNEKGEDIKLSDYLVFKTIEIDEQDVATFTRESAKAEAGTVTGLKDYNGQTTALEVGGVDYLALIVYMPETVGNEANYRGTDVPTIELGINLYATQHTAEEDSFDEFYDKNAWVKGFKVYNANELQGAINAGESAITLMDNIEVTEPVNIPADATVALNLNGKTLSSATNMVIYNEGTLTLSGRGTVESAGQAYAIRVQKGKAIIDSVDINVKGAFGAVSIFNGADVTINGGNYSAAGIAGKTSHTIYMGGYGTLNINGGTFYRDGGGDSGGVIVGYGWENEANKKAVININGGTINSAAAWGWISNYAGAWTTISATGGVFGRNPSAIVADGYKAVENNGKYYVVANTIADENVVGTPAELKTALSGAADAGSGDNTLYLTGDIDLSGSNWTPINVDGYNGAGVITIEGNGATIKGLNAPLFAGGFAGKSGIVIKNLTIADSNIAGGTLGGGAFIDCADSMHVITLENCHLVNSTVRGERAGGLIGWCSGYAKLNDGPVKAYVTISKCSVVDSTVIGNGSAGGIAGHPGASDYTYTTIENCLVKNVDVISYEPVSSWRTGAIVGTANNGHVVINNVTVEDVTLTQDGVTAEETKLYGRFVPSGTGTLVIDGTAVLANATSAGLSNAIASGNTDVYLPAGEYKMPSSSTTAEVNISGTKDTVLDVTLGAYMDSAENVTITGVTIKTSTGKANGNGSDYAALYAKNVTYVDCTFVGPMRVGRDGAKFVNCTFTQLGNDYVWTYGNDVTFEGCTFNTDGKAILIYSDGGNEISQVAVKNCIFNSTQGAKAGAIKNQNCAAIEIHNYGNGVNLVTEGNTYDSNFSGEWRIKTYESGKPKVFVNGTEYTTIAIDGKTMTIDANSNVTVNP